MPGASPRQTISEWWSTSTEQELLPLASQPHMQLPWPKNASKSVLYLPDTTSQGYSQESHSSQHTSDTPQGGHSPSPRPIVIVIGVARLLGLVITGLGRARGLLANDLVRDLNASAGADLAGEGHGLVLALLVTGVVEAAGDVVEEVFVLADALDVALAAAGYLVADGRDVDALALDGGRLRVSSRS